MVYLDNAAGTRPYPQVIETITDVLTNHWGNASSDSSYGVDARTIIDNVVQQVANDINCNSDEIVWTSGSCEANSLAIIGILRSNPRMRFCTTYLEHTSIVETTKNIQDNPISFVKNNTQGFIDLKNLENILQRNCRSNTRTLVSVSFANSEIGTIQDVKSISEIVHKYNGILHTDATQAYPWMKIDVQELGIDLMSVSGQKLNCVKGIGFLYVRGGIKLQPLIYGSQQDGRRGGTYPTHLIAAFGKALELTRKIDAAEIVADLRSILLDELMLINGVRLNGPKDNLRLPNNISLTIDGVRADKLVAMCDLMDIIIAKGSACKSYESKPSATLLAIGLTSTQALNTIRISLDHFNSLSDVKNAADVITKLVEVIRNEENV